MMKTTYKIVDLNGDAIDLSQFEPYTAIDVSIVEVTYFPNTDPEDPSEDVMQITLRYDHDKPAGYWKGRRGLS